MYIFAYACLLAALLCSLACGGMALLQIWQGRADHLPLIRKGHWLLSGCLLLASALLLHALFWEDYRLEYVASYTDSLLPVFYRLTAFWAGQPGSMLFWALMAALCGTIFAISSGKNSMRPGTALWFWVFFHANMAFFCLVLTCWSNPFIAVNPAPVDGNGLNPLLQNPGMIFHPPLLFMGYAALGAPACLALAQLAANEGNERPWFAICRSFIIWAWMFLSAGIILGAWWAYMELGWGGYWAWDPVENASLLPWLAAAAAIHVSVVSRADGKLWRSSAALMAISLVAAFFGTYLTRSGVIQSVHAFGDGGVGTPLLVFVLLSLLVILYAALSAPSRNNHLASLASREGLLVIVAWLFLALAAIILLATIWPVLTSLAGKTSQGLDASFYNRVCLPLGASLLILLCFCLWIGWNGGLARNHGGARLLATICAALAGIAAIWFAGYRQPLALLASGAAIGSIFAAILKACEASTWKNRRLLAGLGAHLGIAVMALGIAFSGPYTRDKELMLAKGAHGAIGPYTVYLRDVADGSGPGYDFLKATLKITKGGEEIGLLSPERRIYAKFGSMQFSEVDVISSLKEDIYASLLGMDEDFRVLVKISIEPLVNWIWIGGVLLCLLPILGLGGFREYAGKRKTTGK